MKKLTVREKLFRKFGPSRLILLSFVLMIGIGTVLLMLPISNAQKGALWIDHLFTAATSTCVTGLVPYALFDQYTRFGHVVILCLIQLGGLGLMSIMAFIMSMMRHKLSFKEKGVLIDSINRSSYQDLNKFLKSIFCYTFCIEALGMILLAIRFVPLLGPFEGLFQSLFLSVSAFCNAGLDLLSDSSLIAFQDDILVNITIIFLIVTGGLGFAVWFDLKNQMALMKQKKWTVKQLIGKLSVHTRIVLISTGVLISGMTLVFYLLECTNPDTIGNLSLGNQLLVSLFQSVTLRTAGFSSVDIGACTRSCQFVMLFVMLIGGSPGGTAGGLKTTTLVLLLLMLKKYMKSEKQSVIMKRSISESSFHKASLIVMTYAFVLIGGILILLMSETHDFLFLSFEAFSALATVGLTCGITFSLTLTGKLVIICLMLIGRVGPATVLLSLKSQQEAASSEVMYPKTEILIG